MHINDRVRSQFSEQQKQMQHPKIHNQGRCPGTSTLIAAIQPVSLFLFISKSNARGKSRPLEVEGCRVSSKSPSRVWNGDEAVAGRNRRDQYFPNKGSLICLPGKSMIFYRSGPLKFDCLHPTWFIILEIIFIYRYCAPELRVLLRKGESGIWSVRSRTAWCRPSHLRTCTLPSWSCRKSPEPSEGREPQHRRHAWKTSQSAIFRFGQRSSIQLKRICITFFYICISNH